MGSALGLLGACVSSVLGSSAWAGPPSAPAPSPTADPGDADGPSSDVVAVSGELQEVDVEGVRSLLLDKLGEQAQQTPQSVSVVSQQLMSSQGDTRLQDALKNVPGITLNAGEGAARGDTVNLRGFSAFNDFYLDGVRDAAVYTRDSFDLQSVEVLKGPSAVLFGRGSTGGAINQVTKAPQRVPLDEVTGEIASNNLYRATADLDTPFSASAAARLNLMGESSQVAERDDVRNRRFGVAPAVSFGLGDADTLTLAYLHQQEDDIPDVGIPFVGDTVANVPRQFDYGLTSDRATTEDDIVTARYLHAFSDEVSLADTLRYANYDFDYVFDAPNFGSHVPTAGEPPADILVGRDAPSSLGSQTNLDEQIDLHAHFRTGPVSHQLAAGVELARQGSLLERYNNPFNRNNNWVPETPLLAPDPYAVAPVEPITSTQHTVAPSGGAYLLDTVGFGPYVALSGGFRYDYFSADYRSLTLSSGALTQLTELNRLGSPRAALIVTPTERETYYLSYGTSFDPSAEALTLTSKTANLGPVKAKTYEAGAKTLWLDGSLSLTGALFHTEVDNAQTNDPDNPNITVLEGNERVNGVELDAEGHLTQHWELTAGYTYLDGRTLASGTAADVGKVMPNVAHDALNLWTEYRLGNWEIGGGGNWLSRRYADSAESVWLPGYVVCNAMASVALSPRLSLQLNGYNLFNKLYYDASYYTSAAENHAIPGAGRSVALTAHLVF
ncbi:MAG TPA: TonB-dependent siderophore receptor [Steroidobacteraceae bacterium]|nr:TonB-dependent siderophore receptor [Steroidobacteraceae bacterium]